MDKTTSETIRQAARRALVARDQIENCVSPAWHEAHKRASELYRAADAAETQERAAAAMERKAAWRRELGDMPIERLAGFTRRHGEMCRCEACDELSRR